MSPPNKYRSLINNNRYLKQLFFETTLADKSNVLYTLKDWDHEVDGKVYPSFYRLYMEIDDPTEWRVSQELVDGWDHWEILCNCNWFKPHVDRWRREVELRFKSDALAKIRSEAKTASREALMANKYLLEKGWEPKTPSGRGRPTKEDIDKAAKDIATNNTRLEQDFLRLLPSNPSEVN